MAEDVKILDEQSAKAAYSDATDWTKYDGQRITSSTGGGIYLIMAGSLHLIPDPFTYNRIFQNWSGIQVNDYLMDNVPMGSPLGEGAAVVIGNGNSAQYLLNGAAKQWIISLEQKAQFNFLNSPMVVDQFVLNAIPVGPNVS
jgi:hypothetical protein